MSRDHGEPPPSPPSAYHPFPGLIPNPKPQTPNPQLPTSPKPHQFIISAWALHPPSLTTPWPVITGAGRGM